MTLDNRYGMRVTEESAPGSDIGRPRDQSYRIIIVIATSVLPGSRETCDVEGEDFTVDKIPNTRCFNCLCKVKKKKKKKSIYRSIHTAFDFTIRLASIDDLPYFLGSSAFTFYVIIRRER